MLSGRVALPILELKGKESQRTDVYAQPLGIEDGIVIGAITGGHYSA